MIKELIFGIASFVPGVSQLRSKGTGGTNSARYCYSVWLRHLVMAKQNGLNTEPKIVAELGPGDSIGIGLAALISGGDRYFAFDAVEHANPDRNLSVFDELVTLFKNRTPIPGDEEFPEVKPQLSDYSFPADILDDDRLNKALETSRIDKIRNSVINPDRQDSTIEYKVPWYEANVMRSASVDTIYSQAVLEHVDDLPNAYSAMHAWLKPTGHISHTIDYKSHGTANRWNGHWAHSNLLWKLIRGKRTYLLNREPHSTHLALMEKVGFKVVYDLKNTSASELSHSQLAPEFASISSDDLVTSEAFVLGVKK